MLQEILPTVLPYLLEVVSLILLIVITAVATLLRKKFGIEIEAKHREALHSALMTGIRSALSGGLRGQDAVDAALDYAKLSVPDAMAKLKPAETVLRDLAVAKLETLLEKK